ncbi:MAG: hypothetical protein NVS1B13_10320 [Flavisolibacter sp.]
MDQKILTDLLEKGIELEPEGYVQIKTRLSAYITYLIDTDLNKLVQLLYRCDIDEQKIRQVLQSYKESDSSLIIAELVLERHRQKIHQRKKFDKPGAFDENEKW